MTATTTHLLDLPRTGGPLPPSWLPPVTSPPPQQTESAAGVAALATESHDPKPGSRPVEMPQFDLSFEGTRDFALDDITVDPEIQTRAKISSTIVKEYADLLRTGTPLPPLVVFADAHMYRLADGFHRLAGAKLAGLGCIVAEVRSGGRQEALRFALGANTRHGLRRTNADKRHAVEIALREFAVDSDRAIAELCGVGNALVSGVRRQVCDSNTSTVRRGRDGKTYPVARSSTAKQRPARKPPNPESTNGAATSAGNTPATAACPDTPEAESGAAKTDTNVVEIARDASMDPPPGTGERAAAEHLVDPWDGSVEETTSPSTSEQTASPAPADRDRPASAAPTMFHLANGRDVALNIADAGECVSAVRAQHILRVVRDALLGRESQTIIAREQHFTLMIIRAFNEHSKVFSPMTRDRLFKDLDIATRLLRKMMPRGLQGW